MGMYSNDYNEIIIGCHMNYLFNWFPDSAAKSHCTMRLSFIRWQQQIPQIYFLNSSKNFG